MDLGPAELGIILVIVLVLFGGKKLPELARSLGQAKKEFESGQGSSNERPSPDTAGREDTAATASRADDAPSARPAEAAPAPARTDRDPSGNGAPAGSTHPATPA